MDKDTGLNHSAALALTVFLLCHGLGACLDNGLAKTPPLAFNTCKAVRRGACPSPTRQGLAISRACRPPAACREHLL